MSATGLESVINDGFSIAADHTKPSIRIVLSVPVGTTRPAITSLSYQYNRVSKYDPSISVVSALIPLAAISIGDNYAANSAVFVGTDSEPARLLLRLDLELAAVASNADYVVISVFNATDKELFANITINIMHNFGKRNLEERNSISSGIGTLPGVPGTRNLFVLFTQFGLTPIALPAEEYGPEIIGASIGGFEETADKRFLGEILGSYYFDAPSKTISQVRGIMSELGVVAGVLTSPSTGVGKSIGDVLGSTDKEFGKARSGYTFILPPGNFVAPGSDNDLVLVFNSGQFSNSFRGADGGELSSLEGMVNFNKFYNNGAAVSSKIQDDVGVGNISMLDTTIATLASQVSFTLAAGSADDDAYNGCIAIIEDATTAVQKAVGIIQDYVGATKTTTLFQDPGIFTMAPTDKISIIAAKQLRLQQTLEGTVMGEVNIAPGSSTSIAIKGLTNTEADLLIVDALKNRVLTFRTGKLQGQSVAITGQAAIVAGVVVLTTTNIAGFANVVANDGIEIT